MSAARYTKDHEWVRLDGDIAVDRHHRLCAGAARRRRLCRAARDRPHGRAGQGGGGRRIGQGGERGLCAGLGRGRRGQRRARRRPGQGQRRPDGRGLVHQAAPRRSQGARRADGRGGLPALCRGAALMRYLPLTDADRRDDAGGDRRRSRSTRCSPTCRRRRGSTGLLDLPRAHGRARGRARAVAHGGEERRGRLGAVLPRRRGLSPSRPGGGRSSDPARRVPDLLHALPAGDRAGHAAIRCSSSRPRSRC